jgi:hypothetical protein
MTMYNSLKSWLNLPITRKPFISYSGAGDKQFGSPVSLMCYMEGSVKVVQNREGIDVTSALQVFINGTHEIYIDDAMVIEDVTYDIIAISPVYREGRKDIWVVYL